MARGAGATRKRLGEVLMQEGIIGEEQLYYALEEQRRSGEHLGEALVRLGLASEDDIASTVVSQYGLPYLAAGAYRIDDKLMKVFPHELLRQYQFCPIDRMGRVLAVIAGGPLTLDVLSELEQYSDMRILVYVGKQSEVRELIEARIAKAPEAAPAAPPPAEQELPSWLDAE